MIPETQHKITDIFSEQFIFHNLRAEKYLLFLSDCSRILLARNL